MDRAKAQRGCIPYTFLEFISGKVGLTYWGSFWPSSRIYVPFVSACRAKMIVLLFLALLLFGFRRRFRAPARPATFALLF